MRVRSDEGYAQFAQSRQRGWANVYVVDSRTLVWGDDRLGSTVLAAGVREGAVVQVQRATVEQVVQLASVVVEVEG